MPPFEHVDFGHMSLALLLLLMSMYCHSMLAVAASLVTVIVPWLDWRTGWAVAVWSILHHDHWTGVCYHLPHAPLQVYIVTPVSFPHPVLTGAADHGIALLSGVYTSLATYCNSHSDAIPSFIVVQIAGILLTCHCTTLPTHRHIMTCLPLCANMLGDTSNRACSTAAPAMFVDAKAGTKDDAALGLKSRSYLQALERQKGCSSGKPRR